MFLVVCWSLLGRRGPAGAWFVFGCWACFPRRTHLEIAAFSIAIYRVVAPQSSVPVPLQQRPRQQVETVSSGAGPRLLQELLPGGCRLRAGSLGPSPSRLLLGAQPAPPGSGASPLPGSESRLAFLWVKSRALPPWRCQSLEPQLPETSFSDTRCIFNDLGTCQQRDWDSFFIQAFARHYALFISFF